MNDIKYTDMVRQQEAAEKQKDEESLFGALQGAQSELTKNQTYELVETIFGEEYRERLEEKVEERDWKQAYGLAEALDKNHDELKQVDEETEFDAQMNAMMSNMNTFIEDLTASENGGKEY